LKKNKILSHDAKASQELVQEKSKVIPKKDDKKKDLKKAKPSNRSNLHLEHKPSDEMDLLISTINNMDLGWKADICKL